MLRPTAALTSGVKTPEFPELFGTTEQFAEKVPGICFFLE
jgi:hypothetical protein